jgi:pyruvate kinase
MLSGETASGKYPVEAVETMSQIAEQAEIDAHTQGHVVHPLYDGIEQREYLAKCAIEATEYLGVKGIITDSKTGQTARHLSAFRGPTPILAICLMDKTQRWLNLSYGVIPILQKQQVSAGYQFFAAIRMLKQKGYVGMEDKIAYLSGTFDGKGNTTLLEINKICDIFENKYRFHVSEK